MYYNINNIKVSISIVCIYIYIIYVAHKLFMYQIVITTAITFTNNISSNLNQKTKTTSS